LIQRNGQVVLRMLPNVKQKTIKPIMEAMVVKLAIYQFGERLLTPRIGV
jgi:hypothetical protein